MMEQTKLSLAEQLKMELMERYGLREDQVQLNLTFYTTDLEEGRKILHDFDKFGDTNILPEASKCYSVSGEHFKNVWVHRRDGYYSDYVNDNEGENDNE